MVISQVRSWLVKKSLLYLNCVHMALKNLLPTNKQDLSRQETFFSYERNCRGKWGVFYCFLRRWGKAFLLTEEILPYKRNTFLLSKGIFIISSFTKGIFIHIYLHSQEESSFYNDCGSSWQETKDMRCFFLCVVIRSFTW